MILNNIQIHSKSSRTYIYIQQSIVFGHLFLVLHYLMAPLGLDPVEGNQRFTSFMVRLLVQRFTAVTYKSVGCVSLVPHCMHVSMCVYVSTIQLV